MAFCVKCGQPLEGDFCGACGADNRATAAPVVETPVVETPVVETPVEAAPAAEAPTYTAPVATDVPPAYAAPAYETPAYEAAAPVKKGLPKWVIPTAIAVVVAVVAVVLFFALGGNKIGMSDEQLINARIDAFESAFEGGDWNGIVGCMDSASREMINSSAEMQSMASMFQMIGGMMQCDFTITELEIEGNRATAEIEMTMTAFGQSNTETEEMTFVKEGNDWYMEGGADLLDF